LAPGANFNVGRKTSSRVLFMLLFFGFVGFAVSALAGQPRQNHSYKMDLVPITIEALQWRYTFRGGIGRDPFGWAGNG
jgi:hypothetical protein